MACTPHRATGLPDLTDSGPDCARFRFFRSHVRRRHLHMAQLLHASIPAASAACQKHATQVISANLIHTFWSILSAVEQGQYASQASEMEVASVQSPLKTI